MNHIKDKIIIITGASSGIGEATAKKLSALGASVMLCARREDALKKVCDSITQQGGKATYHKTDVTKKSDLDQAVKKTLETYGHLDVIINNAGIMPVSLLSLCKIDEWDQMIDINIKGVLYGIAAVYPIFEQQGQGHFINLCSVAGLKVHPGNSVYCATKHAVRAISEGLRMESAGKFRVTNICPGYIESELMYGSSDENTRNLIISGYQQHAIPATSIADAITYAIAQPENTGINEIVVRPTSQEF